MTVEHCLNPRFTLVYISVISEVKFP
uniref:Uncharacterized protein n=1 Tax=Anguilla anguilla TaxID=7936 RepID=A0A0E9RU95_ANGAN